MECELLDQRCKVTAASDVYDVNKHLSELSVAPEVLMAFAPPEAADSGALGGSSFVIYKMRKDAGHDIGVEQGVAICLAHGWISGALTGESA